MNHLWEWGIVVLDGYIMLSLYACDEGIFMLNLPSEGKDVKKPVSGCIV